jgi:hypothetical protein
MVAVGHPRHHRHGHRRVHTEQQQRGCVGLELRRAHAGRAQRQHCETPRAVVAGFTPALTIGTITVALGAAAAVLIPRQRSAGRSLEPAIQPP